MSMFAQAGLVLAAMVVVYAAVRAARLSTELAMFAAALGGALVAGEGLPVRHVAEGAATYLDINLIFFTATLFMNLLKESGGVVFVVRAILRRFHRTRALLLVLLTLLLLIPGALTGASRGAPNRTKVSNACSTSPGPKRCSRPSALPFVASATVEASCLPALPGMRLLAPSAAEPSRAVAPPMRVWWAMAWKRRGYSGVSPAVSSSSITPELTPGSTESPFRKRRHSSA